MKIKINNIIFIIIGALTLTSCQTLNNYGFLKNENEVINNAQSHQRFLTVSREYKNCINEGMYFNKKASESSDSSISFYSKSADILSKCDQMIGDYNTVVDQEKRLKNNAFAIQNYLKSGRLKVASLKLQEFRERFKRDLIYPDGSSFIENVESILDFSNEKNSLELELTNNNKKIKNELRRAWYWKKK